MHIFLDSLVGKRSNNSRSDVQSRVLATLLIEMDGIISCNGNLNHILVVAATNRPDMIDDALLRPGRFDKLIHVPAPCTESRIEILSIYSRKMPFAADIDFKEIANRTKDFSGADVCNICNQAAMNAFQRNFNTVSIEAQDFEKTLSSQKSSLSKSQIQWYYDFEKKLAIK